MTSSETAQRRAVFLIMGIFALMIILANFLKNPLSKSDPLPFALATVRDFEVSTNAVGELDSDQATTICSSLKEEARIISLVDDGTRIAMNDLLVQLDPKPFQEKTDQLRRKVNEWNSLLAAQRQLFEFEKIQAEREINTSIFDYQTALLELEKVQNGDGPIETARLEGLMFEAKKRYEELMSYIRDLEELEKKGITDPIEITQAKENSTKQKKDFEMTERQYISYKNFLLPTLIKTAQAKVERTMMISEETRKAAGFKIGKANADLNKILQELKDYEELLRIAQNELDRTKILAPQPGLVVLKEIFRDGELRKPRVGDVILPNQPIFFLPDVSSMIAKVLIREVDLKKIEVGKPVDLQVDAYPDKIFSGKVAFIGVLAERRFDLPQGEKYFRVSITLLESDANLRPGMTCRVKIKSQEPQEKPLTIPVQAIFNIDREKYCYVLKPDGIEQREITVGLQNDEYVQVLEGLKEEERICLSRPAEERIRKIRRLSPRVKK